MCLPPPRTWYAGTDVAYAYPSHDPTRTPNQNCRDVYTVLGTRPSTLRGAHTASDSLYVLTEETVSTYGNLGREVPDEDGPLLSRFGSTWIAESPDPANPGAYGYCMTTYLGMNYFPMQGDQDFSDGVIDHEWYPEFVWRPGLQPIPGFPPPPPRFSKAELASSIKPAAPVNGVPTYWIYEMRLVKTNQGKLMYQPGWALVKEKIN
jgi:hypothetical protein